MELTEPIESINKQLIDLFGIDTITGQAMYRVIWAADQYEKRLSKFTSYGLELVNPQIMELPKYPQNDLDWKEKWILEQLVLVPEISLSELTTVVSYEPLHVFRDANDNYLPPTLWAAKFAIDCMLAVKGKKSLRKYFDEEDKNPIEAKIKRIDKIEKELFGNETPMGDALALNSGVGYTGPITEK